MSGPPLRLGMITPSSNTALEPAMARLAASEGPGQVTVHATRIEVTSIDGGSASAAQFGGDHMEQAARLVGQVGLAAVAWAGTSGSWLGVDADRALATRLAEATGTPATTSTLALLDGCRRVGARQVALLTPYLGDIVERIVTTYAAEGVRVVSERHLSLSDNRSFGLVEPHTVAELLAGCDLTGVEAVVIACTNLAVTEVLPALERSAGIPVVESTTETFRHALGLARANQPAHQVTA